MVEETTTVELPLASVPEDGLVCVPVAVALDAPDPDDDMANAMLSPEESKSAREAKRPRIEHLPSGTIRHEGSMLPLFDVGDRIVVERKATLIETNPWLDTIVGHVKSIDDDSGTVVLIDEASDARCPRHNFVSFKCAQHDFRLAPARGNPFTMPEGWSPPTKGAPAEPAAPKRGRGRPPGAKNRSKDQIAAEKKLRAETRLAKRLKREAKARAKGAPKR